MFSFTPFPALETANLILRRISLDDTQDLFAMRSDPRMHQHTDTKPDETAQLDQQIDALIVES